MKSTICGSVLPWLTICPLALLACRCAGGQGERVSSILAVLEGHHVVSLDSEMQRTR